MNNYGELMARTRAVNDRKGLNISDPIDLTRLLKEERHLVVAYLPLKGNISGLIMRREDVGVIVINDNRSNGHKRFTIAHEYYHWKYDNASSFMVCSVEKKIQDKIEREANIYASYLLLPQDGLEASLALKMKACNVLNLKDQIEIEQRYQISHTFLSVRLQSMGIDIEEKPKNKSLAEIAKQYGYSKDLYVATPKMIVESEFPTIVHKLLEDGRITYSKHKELLKVINIEAFK